MEKNYLSQEKHDELSRELEELKLNRRREVAGRLEFAKSLGDLSENAEYHAAREEQAEIEERVAQLETILKTSEIVAPHHSAAVEIGSTLVVKKDGGEEQKFTIVGSEEADTATGKLSYQSPLGAALLGKKAGTIVPVETPRGLMRYKVVSIE